MTTMNISLPDEMKAFVDQCLAKDGYSSASEYIRGLIRKDREEKSKEHLRNLLAEGFFSGAPIEADRSYWQKKRNELR